MEKEAQIGQLIAGKYRIEQPLGRGGMGVVVAALHEQLNQRVALKFLTDNAYQQPEAVARFLREARAAVQIQSEHVARVMDVGTLDSGAPYMVMEYLRGCDLKEVSSKRGPLPIEEAVDFVLQACDAVAEAHSLGIVHRDLKPSNLFLTERPDGTPLVKVLDFGISKALHPGDDNSQLQITASAAIMGSPQYMSPEQIRSSKNVDARADIWALGTILHELLTGAPAYVADTVPGLLAMIVADSPPPLSASRRDAPPELEAIILRCLEKDREQRFPSVAALAKALERFASIDAKPLVRRIARLLGEAPPPTEPTPATRTSTPSAEPTGQTHNTWTRTGHAREPGARSPLYRRRGVQLAAGAAALGLGALLWLLLPPPPAPAPRSEVRAVVAAAPPSPSPPSTPAGAAGAAPTAGAGGAGGAAASGGGPAVAPVQSGEARIRPILEPELEAEERAASASSSKSSAPPSRSAEPGPESSRSGRKSASAKAARSAAATKPRPSRHDPDADRSAAPAAAPPPAAPAKKADTLEDLFNDTK